QLAEYFDLRQKHRSSQQDERVIKTIIQENSSVQICQCNPKPKVSSQDQKNIFTSLNDNDSESSDGNNGRCRNCTLPLEKPFSLVEDRRNYFETEASQGWSTITKQKRVASSKTVTETMDFPKASINFKGLTSDLSKGFGQLNLNDGEYATSGFSGIHVPKLKYDTLKEYCTEMCQKLHDEEMANCPDNVQLALTHSDCELEWSDENDRRPNLFTVTVMMTPALTKKYQSQRMQVAERSPFFKGQGMILTLQGESPWYCGVTRFKMIRDEYNSLANILEMTIRSYSWNRPLPTTRNVRRFQLLPVSIPVSRVFTAMSRLENSDFTDLILGRSVTHKSPVPAAVLPLSNTNLNESQKNSIRSVLNNPITVIQGPPGTGKTSTISEMISQLLLRGVYPILVVAASNLAVDNIAEKLMQRHEGQILRVVATKKEKEYSSKNTIGPVCLHNKIYDMMPAEIRCLIEKFRDQSRYLTAQEYKKMSFNSIKCSDSIVRDSKVILTTTVASGGIHFQDFEEMPVVIMDEATQSTETTSLIPLTLPEVKKIVFVGDQKQLNGVSSVPELSFSLFEKLLTNDSFKNHILLDTQYRMHPAISKFPKNTFYDGLLKDGVTEEELHHEGILSNPNVFWDTADSCSEKAIMSQHGEKNVRTFCNVGEVKFVVKALHHLTQVMHVKKANIGVITPYRGQRDLISKA
ncbi:hypothetical protein OXX80_012604, partial [Metschnikowia pulcherrima]